MRAMPKLMITSSIAACTTRVHVSTPATQSGINKPRTKATNPPRNCVALPKKPIAISDADNAVIKIVERFCISCTHS